MRQIDDYKTNAANAAIDVFTTDEKGHGGAHHQYEAHHASSVSGAPLAVFNFQNGPIGEYGVNGITQEILLAIVIDRLRCFQSGPFKCRENALALTKCEEALQWLHSRTRERVSRGVEGQAVA